MHEDDLRVSIMNYKECSVQQAFMCTSPLKRNFTINNQNTLPVRQLICNTPCAILAHAQYNFINYINYE